MQLIQKNLYGLGLGISTFNTIKNKKGKESSLSRTTEQAILVENCLSLGDLLHQTITGNPLSGRVSPCFLRGLVLTPMICYFLSNYTNKSGWCGKTINLIQNHLNTVGMIAISITAVSLLALGFHALGISFLAGSAFEMLCQREVIPISIKNSTFLIKKVVFVSFSLLFSSWLIKIMTIFQISVFVLQKFFHIDSATVFGKCFRGEHFARDVEKTPLTTDIVNKVLTSNSPNDLVKINYRHFDKNNFSQEDIPQKVYSFLQSHRRNLCEGIFKAFLSTSLFIRFSQLSYGEDFTYFTENPFMKYLKEPFAYEFNDTVELIGNPIIIPAMYFARVKLVKYFHEGGAVKGEIMKAEWDEDTCLTINDIYSGRMKEYYITYNLEGYNVANILDRIHKIVFKNLSSESENTEHPMIEYLFNNAPIERFTYVKNPGMEKKLILLLLIHLGVFNFSS